MSNATFASRVTRIYPIALVTLALGIAVLCETTDPRERAASLEAVSLPSMRTLQLWINLALALGAGGLLTWAAIRGQQALTERVGAWLLAGVLATAGVGSLQYAFDRDYYFDVGDNFHYYTGAKYFGELDYVRIYECISVALESEGLRVPKRYRDLSDNHVRRTMPALDDGARKACRKAFSPARWPEFQADVVAFNGFQSLDSLARRFLDHGYNGTPIWTTVAGSLANIFPVTASNQTLLALLNLLFLAGSWWLVLRAFGWEVGLVYALLFWTQYADHYLLGGAYLRYLWISLLSAGAALYKLNRVTWAGVCVGTAAGLLIFPGMFLAAAALFVALRFAMTRKWEASAMRFVVAGGVTLVLWCLLSVVYTEGLSSWITFFDKMELNSGRLATGRIGFLFNFIWPKPFAADPEDYAPAMAALKEPLALGISLNHVRVLLVVGLLGALARALRKADALCFTLVIGFALFFLGFPTVRYYYAGFVALPLAVHAAPRSAASRGLLAGLCALTALCWALHSYASHSFLHNTVLTAGFTLVLIGLALPKVAASLHGASAASRAARGPRSPAEGAPAPEGASSLSS